MKHVEAALQNIHNTARALHSPILLPATAPQQQNPTTLRYQRACAACNETTVHTLAETELLHACRASCRRRCCYTLAWNIYVKGITIFNNSHLPSCALLCAHTYTRNFQLPAVHCKPTCRGQPCKSPFNHQMRPDASKHRPTCITLGRWSGRASSVSWSRGPPCCAE